MRPDPEDDHTGAYLSWLARSAGALFRGARDTARRTVSVYAVLGSIAGEPSLRNLGTPYTNRRSRLPTTPFRDRRARD
jgi:hypothetical protein